VLLLLLPVSQGGLGGEGVLILSDFGDRVMIRVDNKGKNELNFQLPRADPLRSCGPAFGSFPGLNMMS
jgi:hypothetical protein